MLKDDKKIVNKEVEIRIRVTKEQKKLIQEYAKLTNQTVSDLGRTTILNYIKDQDILKEV